LPENIRVALIGSGYIAAYHARAIRDAEGAELALVCARNEERLRQFAEKYGAAGMTGDVNQVIERDDIDAVVLCTPNRYHAEHAVEILRHGKDVLVEKPLARSFEEGAAVAEAGQASGQVVMVGHMWRFDVEVRYVKELVESGRLGRIVRTWGYGVHENWGPSGWFTDRELAGGGALLDMGVHALDTVRFLLGEPRAVQVTARLETCFGDYQVDDTGTLMIRWDNGVTSVVESGWWHPHVEGPEAATRLLGTRGWASLFPTRAKLVEEPGAEPEFLEPEMPARTEHCDQVIYDRQMEHFLSSVRSRETPVPGAREGLEVLRIVDAAFRSTASGETVQL
jgi:predicted dehydrogenase